MRKVVCGECESCGDVSFETCMWIGECGMTILLSSVLPADGVEWRQSTARVSDTDFFLFVFALDAEFRLLVFP